MRVIKTVNLQMPTYLYHFKLSQELIEKDPDKDFYNLIRENYLYLFPKLPDYIKFILRIKKLGKLLNVLFDRLFCNDVSDGFVDTIPIEMIIEKE